MHTLKLGIVLYRGLFLTLLSQLIPKGILMSVIHFHKKSDQSHILLQTLLINPTCSSKNVWCFLPICSILPIPTDTHDQSNLLLWKIWLILHTCRKSSQSHPLLWRLLTNSPCYWRKFAQYHQLRKDMWSITPTPNDTLDCNPAESLTNTTSSNRKLNQFLPLMQTLDFVGIHNMFYFPKYKPCINLNHHENVNADTGDKWLYSVNSLCEYPVKILPVPGFLR